MYFGSAERPWQQIDYRKLNFDGIGDVRRFFIDLVDNFNGQVEEKSKTFNINSVISTALHSKSTKFWFQQTDSHVEISNCWFLWENSLLIAIWKLNLHLLVYHQPLNLENVLQREISWLIWSFSVNFKACWCEKSMILMVWAFWRAKEGFSSQMRS